MTQANEQGFEQGDDSEAEGPPAKAAPATKTYAVPEGYETVGSNVAGYWDPDPNEGSGPIEFRITGVRLIDNGKEKQKSSCLILVELLKPVQLIKNSPKKEEQVLTQFEAGTTAGIWAKAGMRDLQHQQGANLWMAPDGYRKMKDDDKNDMALFKVARTKGSPKGETIQLIEDARKQSVTEAATAENPPWYLIALGPDYGKAVAKELLLKKLAGNN